MQGQIEFKDPFTRFYNHAAWNMMVWGPFIILFGI